ncbi:MAG: hypothetical protein R3F62_26135 [Planctomycetota bacterium]
MSPGSRWGACVLALWLALSSGCQGAGQWSSDLYVGSSSAFTPNPASVVPYFVGLGTGFVLGLPLCLVSLPLALWSHGGEDDERFFGLTAISPSLTLGSLTGSALGAPFYPLGWPFVPDEPKPDLGDLAR